MDKKERLKNYQNRLHAYYKAEMSILEGAQSYSLGSRTLTRANLKEIKEMIDYLEKNIATLQSQINGKGRNRVFAVVPRDY